MLGDGGTHNEQGTVPALQELASAQLSERYAGPGTCGRWGGGGSETQIYRGRQVDWPQGVIFPPY